MSTNKSQRPNREGSQPSRRMLLFPIFVLVAYGVLSILTPEQALAALRSSGKVCLSILPPLVMVFLVMLLLNLFVKPARIARFLGGGANIKSVLLSMVAGVISMGPIYIWHPLLKDLREKGASDTLIAVFLYSRAVKPFLLPVLIACFGWIYAGILTVLTLLASFINGYLINTLLKGDHNAKYKSETFGNTGGDHRGLTGK